MKGYFDLNLKRRKELLMRENEEIISKIIPSVMGEKGLSGLQDIVWKSSEILRTHLRQ